MIRCHRTWSLKTLRTPTWWVWLWIFPIACGGDGDGETVSEAPPNVEQQLQDLAAELTEIRCEIKAMETPGSEVDTEKRDELQSQSKKVVKKALGVLNGNRLQGPEINRLRMQYLDPALNTTDC